jgi:hypothetical protein
LASDGNGRFEINTQKILGRAFSGVTPPVTEEEVICWIQEYISVDLLFVYEHEGRAYGQWDTNDSWLPKYKRAEDHRTPAPPENAFQAWRDDYQKFKAQHQAGPLRGILEKFKKRSEKVSAVPPENLQNGAESFLPGVGVGVVLSCDGEGKSCAASSTPPSPAPLPLLLESELQTQPAVIALPCSSGPDFQVVEAHVAEFQQLYPAVDVMQQLREMRGWLISNAKQKKTHGGMMRFINAWLSKEQDNAPRRASSGSGSYRSPARVPVPAPASAPAAVPKLPADLNRNTGPKAWAVILEQLRKHIDPNSFQTWIRPLKGIGISKGVLYVRLPSVDFEEVVSEQWGEQINAAAEAIGLSAAVKFISGGGTCA